MKQVEFLIIGAGPTGLGAAHRLLELGHEDFLVLEAAEHAGGLASSFVDEAGFTWDLGSHLQHSHYEKFDQYMDLVLQPDEWLHHDRSTWIWHSERFIPYPFQLNLHRLPEAERWKCVQGLMQVTDKPVSPDANFAEWCLATFGTGISAEFMLPYNEKIWARPLEELGSQWVRDRVATPKLTDVLRSICLNQDSTSWGPNAKFRYPKRGGTGSIWKRIANRLPVGKILFGMRAEQIHQSKHIVTGHLGFEYGYQHLINTMPLDLLVKALRPANDFPQTAGLRKNATHVFGFGLSGKHPARLDGRCWGYYPQPDLPFYRLTMMSNLSPWNTPHRGEWWSIMAEVAESKSVPQSGDLVAKVERGLRNVGIFDDSSQLISRWHKRLPYGYPVPSINRDEIVDHTLATLESDHIYSRGRFGAWKYEVSNQDHSFMQGVEVVDHILFNRNELTLHEPNLVNSRHNSFPFPEWASDS
ncbi:MAG TPA: FAD-dependent oxidoreductase [Pirellulaceae bacterium]|nr:FAD-dependent oxidoreductase [Pirellulaceae bacterium]